MAEPVRDPETGGRSLADILREAGIENPSRPGRRRRWEDVDDTGIRQRRARPVTDPSQSVYGRRSTDVRDGDRARDGRREAGPRGERDARPERPARGEAAVPGEAVRGEAVRGDGLSRSDTAARGERRHAVGRGGAPDPSTAAIPGLLGPSRKPGVPTGATAVTPARTTGPHATTPPRSTDSPATTTTDRPAGGRRSTPAAPAPAPATGPIPVVHDQGDDALVVEEIDAGGREGALAWLRFAGELVIALAVGVGVYFAFTVLWEMIPYLAVLAAPLAVTGMVTGVSIWRHRLGRPPAGARLVGVLVFAGTLLTILPAAGLLNAG